ncbi:MULTISPECIES: hypothetical protein [Burkholderia]|uniref:hypothetical protein n=1 Tax=Burkholderia TaxID=32008 RepID=UPI001177D245|nr:MULTISPECIES: hypothetical protein [Burkholderia]EKS9798080.1 hypothetical protein [Burkholderia cepacia]EKS9805141.1 hypothetical protein [Burkholderia cepacia]EKS9812186.1 hypothetical protein [Burkholderia cepacia]EKS9822209.1 hypothetical protein [Burkholderia cepacia]EKS9829198.1 hypothetical protein [Burkholderia cepacia]
MNAPGYGLLSGLPRLMLLLRRSRAASAGSRIGTAHRRIAGRHEHVVRADLQRCFSPTTGEARAVLARSRFSHPVPN